jgi:plasmid stability protein
MPVQITIEDVPEEVLDKLAARAARRGQSMEEFIRCELEKMASLPYTEPSRLSQKQWVERVRKRVEGSGVRIPASVILDARDADRK